jgi:hypothetical protein
MNLGNEERTILYKLSHSETPINNTITIVIAKENPIE